MKLTNLAVIFVIIISPFLFISTQTSKVAIEDQKLRTYYDNIIDNAIQDAAFILSRYGHDRSSNARQIASDAFFDSLYYSFNSYTNPTSKARVDACLPILVFLEKEGFFLYALNPYKNVHGQTEIKHTWFPMQHYIGETLSGRFSVRYTLDNSVYVYDQIDNAFSGGNYQEYKDKIPFFNDVQTFENLRIAAIKNSVQKEIMSYMNQYNQWSSGKSLYVSLKFPSIEDSDWKRAIADEGILVFAQGFPVLSGKSYSHYALGGARVIRKAPIAGYSWQGLPYYCRTDCKYYLNTVLTDPSFDKDSIIYFSDAYEAAQNGYFPCLHCE
jgi:hypothetical protein